MKGVMIQRRSDTAFTLIEMTIATALWVILIAAACFVFYIILRNWNSGQNRSYMRQEATLALERMEKELAEAREITVSQTKNISFWWKDNVVVNGLRDTGEVVNYSWSGTAGDYLNRNTNLILVDNVQSFNLDYRNLNNVALTPSPGLTDVQRDSIRFITITLTLTSGGETMTFINSVMPQNIKQARGPW